MIYAYIAVRTVARFAYTIPILGAIYVREMFGKDQDAPS